MQKSKLATAHGPVNSEVANLPGVNQKSENESKKASRGESLLHHRLEFESLIRSLSVRFISIGSGEIDRGISDALQQIGRFQGVDRTYVFMFSPDQRFMENTHEWCAKGIEPQIGRLHDLPVSNLAWSNEQLLNGQILHIPRVADLPEKAKSERQEFQRQGIQSLLAVPMHQRDRVVGFLGFDAVRSEKKWSEESINLLETIGPLFANSIERKRAEAVQAGQRRFLELLASGAKFSDTLRTLVQIVEEQWPGMLGLILLLDQDGKHLHCGASVRLPGEYLESIEGLEIGPMVGSCGTACYRRERVIVEDIATDSRWEGLRDLALKYQLRACWSEPVFDSNGQVIGTFAMYYRQPRKPTELEIETIESGAHLVGIAIEQKRAREAVQKAYKTLEQRVDERTRGLKTLLEMSNDIASTLDLEPLLGKVLDQLRVVVRYSGASVMVLDGPDLSLVAYRGPIPESKALEIHFNLENALANREVVKRRAPVIVDDILGDSSLARAIQQAAGDQLNASFGYIRSWMGVPLMVKDQIVGMLTLDHKDPFFYSANDAEYALAFASQVAIAMENARLYREEKGRLEESEQRRKVAENLRDIISILNSNRSLDEVLHHIVSHANKLLKSDACIFYRVEDKEIVLEASDGFQEQAWVPRKLPRLASSETGYTLLDKALQAHVPYAISNSLAIELEKVFISKDLPDEVQRWRRALADDYRAFLSVPLVIGEGYLGSLSFHYREPRQITDEDIHLGVSFGEQVSLAIENARLREKAEEAAVAAERSRLARELHDSVTQTLFSSTLIAEVLPRIWEKNPKEGWRRLEELRELTRGALAEMRTLLLELRPASLIEAELGDLLRQLVESTMGRARLPVELIVTGECTPSPEVKIAFYRVAQEALNNIAKHSGAYHAKVLLDCCTQSMELRVIDDGNGFDVSCVPPEKLGLGIMNERANGIGADLIVESCKRAGTTVVLRWSDMLIAD